jgi:signal transduction histidine kinase/ActR/RegA family two-component response regulator
MKAQLADLPILAKFLLLPAIAAVLMVVLGGLYVVEQRDTVALQERISDQDVPRLNELSRLFSQFSTNHVQFINLLAVSLRDSTAEGQFYRAGRDRILAVNRAIEELRVVSESITHDDPTRALAQQLQRRLVEYRDQMGEAVLLSSVSLHQIARVALEANQAYDAANAEFLGLVAHVQDDVARQSELLLGRLQAARWRFFVALSVTIALIAVASVLLSRRFASDVASLMRRLDRLSAGDTKTAAPVRERRDEFGAVNKAVHAFRAALQRRDEAERALAALNADLECRVERRTAQLAASRDEAERANQAKSEFLSRMSHELRTPMNAILGFGQLLERSSAVPLANRAWVREIVVAGEHLLELINDVLDLARVESGKFTVSPEPVALRPLIEECLTLLRPLAEAGGVRLLEASRHCDVQMRADRTRLKQVLLNLLSNAVKYNRRNGSVNVVCVAELSGTVPTVCVRVSDTGAGLTREQTARLFVPFERLEADQQRIEGTGIGLALSKRLVEAMGGAIGVESTPGSGSTFWVRLPLAADPIVESATDDDEAAPSERMPLAPIDVLCIEDNPANLRLIEGIFARQTNIRLLSALAPGLGLELARTHRPALILLDINLPDMDGFAVMQCLRENEATRQIPVLAISANAMPKDIERGKAAGFVAYMTKPIDVAELLRTVMHLVGAQRVESSTPL